MTTADAPDDPLAKAGQRTTRVSKRDNHTPPSRRVGWRKSLPLKVDFRALFYRLYVVTYNTGWPPNSPKCKRLSIAGRD